MKINPMGKYFEAKISNGRLLMQGGKERFLRAIQRMPEGKYLLELTKISDRTDREWQKWYRVLLAEMSLDTGYKKQEMHELAKADVLSLMDFSSTTELSGEKWAEYIERLGEWALENFDFII